MCGQCGASFNVGGANNVLGGVGAAGAMFSRGAGGDIASYMVNKAAVENLESHGQGDSLAADMARAGLQATKIKIYIGIGVAIVFGIIFLIVLSKMNAAQQQFNNQFQNFQQNSGFQSPSTTFCTNLQGIATSC